MATSANGVTEAANAPLGGLRFGLILSALCLLLVASWVAMRQAPESDPLNPAERWSKEWWRQPVEWNGLQRLPVISTDFRDATFLKDSLHGWAVGSDSILATTDGGITWQEKPKPEGSGFVSAIHFSDEARGWLGTRGHIWSTDDGGTHWTHLSDVRGTIRRFQFTDRTHGWALTLDGLLSTEDGGRTWAERPVIAKEVGDVVTWSAMHFSDTAHGWICDQYSPFDEKRSVFSTDDAGLNWVHHPIPPGFSPQSIYFRDSQTGWLVGDGTTSVASILFTRDGGRTWAPSDVPIGTNRIQDIQFTDGLHGIAVGAGGVVLATSDAGLSWNIRSQAAGSPLLTILRFANAKHGWALGTGGALFKTSDGGTTWHPQSAPLPTRSFAAIGFSGKDTGWTLVGDDDEMKLLTTVDAGRSWDLNELPADIASLIQVQILDGKKGWATAFGRVFNDRPLLSTTDAGKHWTRQEIGREHFLPTTVQFVDGKHGWIVGTNETDRRKPVLLHTDSGGSEWVSRPLPSGTDPLPAVQFISETRGWMATRQVAGGIALHSTDDGGLNWKLHRPPVEGQSAWVTSLRFVDTSHGWLNVQVGGQSVLFATRDGGFGWVRQNVPTSDLQISAIDFVDAQHGWLVANRSEVFATNDGGSTWKSQETPRSARGRVQINSIHFVDSKTGWAAAADGILLKTDDGGDKWVKARIFPDAPVDHQVWSFRDSQVGYWINDNKRFETHDGGRHWPEMGEYRRYFAPWWWAAAALAVTLCAIAVAIDPGTIQQPSSVEGRLAPDAPITDAAQDQLGYRRIAEGLAGFITNPATAPPFSISITGPWGKGKSSIMSLLRRRLAEWRFPIVWFNAWHHQKSEQILASLFAHIRDQAIPSWFSRRGLAFRLRLAGLRWRESGLLIPLLLSAVFLCAWYASDPRSARPWIASVTTTLATQASDKVAERPGLKPKVETQAPAAPTPAGEPASAPHTESASGAIDLAIGFAGVAAGLFVLGKGLILPLIHLFSAFGVTPGALSSMAKGLRPGSLASAPAARYRFAKDFGEVCAAFGIRRLVVFIDDIDRCDPAVVPEVLELVNFLMSSGDCFVVLGAEKTWVQAAIANAYKDLAKTIGEQSGRPEVDTPKEFAKRYLEKLLNLEVSVTTSGDNVVKQMLEKRAASDSKSDWIATLQMRAAQYWPIAAVVGLITAAAMSGTVVGSKRSQSAESVPVMEASRTAVAPKPASPECVASGPECLKETQERADAEDRGYKPVEFVPGLPDSSSLHWIPAAVAATVLLLLSIVASMRIPRFIRQDSPNFQRSLEIWADWLSERHTSPRSFKRFVNKVRFLAMLQRGEQAQAKGWRRPAWRLSSARKRPASEPPDLLSPAIVAYAAILTRQNGWRHERLAEALPTRLPPSAPPSLAACFDQHGGSTLKDVYLQLAKALTDHRGEISFDAAARHDAWLPPPDLRRLIEQVVLPDEAPPIAEKASPGPLTVAWRRFETWWSGVAGNSGSSGPGLPR